MDPESPATGRGKDQQVPAAAREADSAVTCGLYCLLVVTFISGYIKISLPSQSDKPWMEKAEKVLTAQLVSLTITFFNVVVVALFVMCWSGQEGKQWIKRRAWDILISLFIGMLMTAGN